MVNVPDICGECSWTVLLAHTPPAGRYVTLNTWALALGGLNLAIEALQVS